MISKGTESKSLLLWGDSTVVVQGQIPLWIEVGVRYSKYESPLTHAREPTGILISGRNSKAIARDRPLRDRCLGCSDPAPLKLGTLWLAVKGECAMWSGGVGTDEDPVLPCAQATKNLALHRLGTGKS